LTWSVRTRSRGDRRESGAKICEGADMVWVNLHYILAPTVPYRDGLCWGQVCERREVNAWLPTAAETCATATTDTLHAGDGVQPDPDNARARCCGPRQPASMT
jgi:hypothetical protein